MEITLRAKLAQIATKPRKYTQKGDLAHVQYTNINLFVDVSDAKNNKAICKMQEEGLEGDYLLVTIATLQETLPGPHTDHDALDDDETPLLDNDE